MITEPGHSLGAPGSLWLEAFWNYKYLTLKGAKQLKIFDVLFVLKCCFREDFIKNFQKKSGIFTTSSDPQPPTPPGNSENLMISY